MNETLLKFIKDNPSLSSKEIYEKVGVDYSYATLKRTLAKLAEDNLIKIVGKGRGTKYKLSPSYELLNDIDVEVYFSLEQDERQIKSSFNLSLMPEIISGVSLFTPQEQLELTTLQMEFAGNVASLSKNIYDKEMERLAIDLSWKSSQIEGNTYSCLQQNDCSKSNRRQQVSLKMMQ